MSGFELPVRLPIFPLPDVVLFPDTRLPLHLFEPRYRQLGADVAVSGGPFGMVLLRPPARSDSGSSDVFSVGCAGPVSELRELPDGRFDLVLDGVRRFRVVGEEETDRLYRVARVEPLLDPPPGSLAPGALERLAATRRALEQLVSTLLAERGVGDANEVLERIAPLDDATLVHSLASGLGLPPLERQSLLECDGLVERAELLLSLLTMLRAQSPDTPAGSPSGARTLN